MKQCKHPCCGEVCRKPRKQKVRKPIPKVSAKRKVKNSLYNQKASAFKKLHPFCKAKVEGCKTRTTDIHHRAGKEGDLLLDENNFLPVCRNCHDWIEAHPEAAKEKGLSLSRLINYKRSA